MLNLALPFIFNGPLINFLDLGNKDQLNLLGECFPQGNYTFDIIDIQLNGRDSCNIIEPSKLFWGILRIIILNK